MDRQLGSPKTRSPMPALAQAGEALVHRLRVAMPLGQIARVQDPEGRVHKQTIVDPGATGIGGLAPQEVFDAPRLCIRHFVSPDHRARPESIDPERNESALSSAKNPECRFG